MYKHLKSGTDIRGIASDIYGGAVNLTDQAVYDISRGFARFLADSLGKKATELKIAVGHDSRITAARIVLMEEDTPVGEIAARLGFSSQAYFTMTFKKIMDMTPGAVRAKHRSKTGD